MSHSEPRKPLNFPQRGIKKEWAKWVKGGGRGQIGERKRSDKCVPNEKRRQDEKDYSFPGGTTLTFKEPFCGSCTSVPFQTGSSSAPQTTNTTRKLLRSGAAARSFPHGQSLCIHWTWHESIQVSPTESGDSAGIRPTKEFVVFRPVATMLMLSVISVWARGPFCHLLDKLSSHDSN